MILLLDHILSVCLYFYLSTVLSTVLSPLICQFLQKLCRLLALLHLQLLPPAGMTKFYNFLHAYEHSDLSALTVGLKIVFPPPVCSAHPVVVLATDTAWCCVRAGRAATHCQTQSVPKMAARPPGCAVTCSAALLLSG